jgi:hypothetical protein
MRNRKTAEEVKRFFPGGEQGLSPKRDNSSQTHTDAESKHLPAAW